MKLSRQRLGWFLIGLGAVLVAAQTLTPQARAIPAVRSSWLCFACEDLAGIDILFNVLLFIPLGLGLRLSGVSRRWGVYIAAMLSCLIELLQISVVTGRDSSVRDILMNTTGALFGVVFADSLGRLAFPSPAAARRLCLFGAVGWLVLSSGEAVLLERAFPPTVWYGQRAPEGVFPATFTGHVGEVRVNALDLRGTRLANGDLVRDALRGDRWTLLVDATAGEPTRDLSSVFSIFDNEQREMLVVGQKGTDLLFRYRTRAANLGFRSPSIVVPRVFEIPAGEPIRISISFDRGVVSLTASTAGRTVARRVSVSPSWGWSLLLPFDASVDSPAPLWSGLWIALPLVPTGYWMGRGIPARRALVFGAVVVALGTSVIPILFRLAPPNPWEWMAGAAGPVAGWWLARAVTRRWPGTSA